MISWVIVFLLCAFIAWDQYSLIQSSKATIPLSIYAALDNPALFIYLDINAISKLKDKALFVEISFNLDLYKVVFPNFSQFDFSNFLKKSLYSRFGETFFTSILVSQNLNSSTISCSIIFKNKADPEIMYIFMPKLQKIILEYLYENRIFTSLDTYEYLTFSSSAIINP